MTFFVASDQFCVRLVKRSAFMDLWLIVGHEPATAIEIKQCPHAYGEQRVSEDRVRAAVLSAAEEANQSLGTSLWPWNVEFQTDDPDSTPSLVRDAASAAFRRLATRDPSDFAGTADDDAR